MEPTEKQLTANRANAAKSTGPRTVIGKRNSSRNGLKHGILSNAVLLDGESRATFVAIYTELEHDLRPADVNERILVQTMALAHWRRLRACTLETAGINHEQRRQPVDETDQHPLTRTIKAIRAGTGETGSLAIIGRYETRFDTQYNRALDRFLRVRAQKRTVPDEPSDLLETKGSAQ